MLLFAPLTRIELAAVPVTGGSHHQMGSEAYWGDTRESNPYQRFHKPPL